MATSKDFGGFEILEKLGSGGMASVYLAVQKSLQRKVVLKIIHPHLAEDEKLVMRFEREARAAAQMRHENIIQVIDCGRHDDIAYIAMEFVEGMDLRKWLEAHGTPPLEMGLLMLHDLCRGLEHAHAHHIVHRDIKPANLMLTPDGTIKLMDFGLARGGVDTATQMTVVGSVLGTPAYMSPEQATGEVVDERADIFSAGVVAYELLGGSRPFSGESYSTVLRSILTVDPPEVPELNPLVTPEVARIVHGMLQKDVAKRTATIRQVREELGTVIEQMGLTRWRDLLREYVRDPEGVGQRWRKKRLARHLDQGMYFENMGLGKIDDAMLEFKRVLHLDPGNSAAKQHVHKLETERNKLLSQASQPQAPQEPDKTVVMSAPPAPPPGAPPAPGAPPPAAPPPDKPSLTATQRATAAPRPGAAGQAGQPTVVVPPDQSSYSSVTPAPAAQPTTGGGLRRVPVPLLAVIGALIVAIVVVGGLLIAQNNRSEPPLPQEPQDHSTGTSEEPVPPPVPAVVDTAVTPPAAPTPPTEPTKPPMEKAQELFAASQYTEAANTLRKAIASHDIPRAEVRSARELMARAYARAGRKTDAAKVYADILQEQPAFTPDPRASNKADLAAFEAAKALVKPAAPPATGPGTLVVHAQPFASVLTLDGQQKDANKSLFRFSVPPGHHTVTIKHPSLGEQKWSVDVKAGETLELSYDFIKASAGKISVTAQGGWGEIYIDGQSTHHTTPAVIEGILPGEHVVSLVSTGYSVEGGPRRVEVKVGEQISVQFKLKKK